MRWIFLLGLTAVAHADASVPTKNEATARRCDFTKTEYYTESGRAKPPRPGMYFVQRSSTHSLWATEKDSAVFSMTGEMLRLKTKHAAALVERGRELVGVLAIDSDKHEIAFYDVRGERRWATTIKDLWGESASAVVDGNSVIVTNFHRIASGSQLFRLDLATGGLEWTADVEQLNVPHSKYFNDVVVHLESGSVTLYGTEAGGCYVQTFDPATGKRRSSVKFGR